MPPPSKKRETAERASATPSFPVQQGIRAFGKITKSTAQQQELGKKRIDGKDLPEVGAASNSQVLQNNKKRRLQSSLESSVKPDLDHDCNILMQAQRYKDDQYSITERSLLPTSSPLSLIQQATPRKKQKILSISGETPTKGARSCFESLELSSFPGATTNSSPSPNSPETAPSSLASFEASRSSSVLSDTLKLPDELQDLINLYSSFLTALSIHYVHYGSLTPADLRILRPSVERAWRKRKVSNNDLRRILAIAHNPGPISPNHKLPPRRGILSLSDYGSGKVCIEIEEDTQSNGLQRRPLDEETLNKTFAANLITQWTQHVTSNLTSPDPVSFITLLPLLPITCNTSLSKSHLLSKGKLCLSDLKAGAIRAQLSSQKASLSYSAATSSTLAPTSRNDSLLTRIRAKQLHRSSLPAAPSPATLSRKSALHRLEEIAPVLEILTSSASRSVPAPISDLTQRVDKEPDSDHGAVVVEPQRGTCAFTMPTLVQHLQMSLRNPIAKEEAAHCVRLLATEVAPGWVRLREVGRVVGVTVWRGGRLGREEVRRRVEGLLGGGVGGLA